MGHQICRGSLQLCLSGGIGGERFGSEGGEQLFPDGVQLVLEAVRVGGDRDYGILLGNHYAERAGATGNGRMAWSGLRKVA